MSFSGHTFSVVTKNKDSKDVIFPFESVSSLQAINKTS